MDRNTRESLLLVAAILLILWAMTLIPVARAQTMMPPGTPATPGTACGAEGVGYDPVSRSIVRMAAPGYRVNASGNWEQCDRPCIGDSKPREWTVNGNTCTTATPRGYSGVDDPRLNRALRHGTNGYWQDNDQRGLLIERCDDGTRTVLYSSCVAPVAPSRVASAPTPASAPVAAPQGCIGAVRRNGLTAVVPRRLAEGESTAARLGLRYVPVWCRDGRLTLDPPALTREQAASAADAWRR